MFIYWIISYLCSTVFFYLVFHCIHLILVQFKLWVRMRESHEAIFSLESWIKAIGVNEASWFSCKPTKQTHLGGIAESQAKETCRKYQKKICNYVCRRCTVPRSHYAERTIKVESRKWKTFFIKAHLFSCFYSFFIRLVSLKWPLDTHTHMYTQTHIADIMGTTWSFFVPWDHHRSPFSPPSFTKWHIPCDNPWRRHSILHPHLPH